MYTQTHTHTHAHTQTHTHTDTHTHRHTTHIKHSRAIEGEVFIEQSHFS